jgi:hypothetical protein
VSEVVEVEEEVPTTVLVQVEAVEHMLGLVSVLQI